jgi:hypothetical protein
MVETTILKVIPIVVICIGLIVGGFVYFSNVNDFREEVVEEKVCYPAVYSANSQEGIVEVEPARCEVVR